MNENKIISIFLKTLAFSLLVYAVYSLFCSTREVFANIMSALGTILAAYLTLKVSESADNTSKEAIKISHSMRKMEVFNEGPAIFIQEVFSHYNNLNNGGTNGRGDFKIVNVGNSVAHSLEFSLPLKNIDHKKLFLNVDRMNEGETYFSLRIEFIDGTSPENLLGQELILNYKNLAGDDFRTYFSFNRRSIESKNLYNVKFTKVEAVDLI